MTNMIRIRPIMSARPPGDRRCAPYRYPPAEPAPRRGMKFSQQLKITVP